MKILLSWLNEYGDFGDPTDPVAVQRVADALTSLGLEVDSVTEVGASVAGVVTAKVLRLEQHPDAAKVQRVYVDAGDGQERHVWCGAFNMAPGDVIPMATLGTTMPDGRTIERRGILGIDSEGMLCSATELGIGDDHSGIYILPAGTPLGVPYGDALGLTPDVLIDADVTRNRPDCWGYVGIARDLAAKLGVEFRPPSPELVVTGPERTATVEISPSDQAGKGCARFTSTVISGVEVGPSADWMARRLTAAGMRPISNVVDVSNYVMLELNQPNHAYDLDTLGGGGFRVRSAHDGERLTTLDGQERTFTDADLLICDANDVPIGLAGIMGGLDTEISEYDDHDRARDGVVRDRRHRPGRHPQRSAIRGVGPLRARCRSVRDAHRHRPVRRTVGRDVPEPRRARRRRRRRAPTTSRRPTAPSRFASPR